MRWLTSCTILLLSVTPGLATPITYNLTGIVDNVGTTPLVAVSAGQSIPIAITVNDAFKQDTPGSGEYTFNGGNPAVGFVGPIIIATFAGETFNASFQNATVTSSGLRFSTFTPQTSTGFQLNLQGNFASVGGAFPASINQADITAGTFSVIEAFSVDSYGYSGTIAGAQAVPEPASAALLAVGILGCLAWSARSRATTSTT